MLRTVVFCVADNFRMLLFDILLDRWRLSHASKPPYFFFCFVLKQIPSHVYNNALLVFLRRLARDGPWRDMAVPVDSSCSVDHRGGTWWSFCAELKTSCFSFSFFPRCWTSISRWTKLCNFVALIMKFRLLFGLEVPTGLHAIFSNPGNVISESGATHQHI